MSPGQLRDAQELPLAPHRGEFLEPRHPACWIRLRGQWRPGWIRHWHVGTTGWLAWVQYPDLDDKSWPRFGMFGYDPATIKPRREGEGPPP